MNVFCLPAASLNRRAIVDTVLISLLERSPRPGVGVAGATFIDQVRRAGLMPAARAWDLLSIALSVTAADSSCSRATSADGWTREINLTVSVSEPDFWLTVIQDIEFILRFLTQDIWRIHFVAGPAMPAWDAAAPFEHDGACLLSGGVDSLIGLTDLTNAGRRMIAVSQVAPGDKEHQREFVRAMGDGVAHVQLNHVVRPPGNAERSQRSRSFIFLAYGVLAASSTRRFEQGEVVELFIPENGFISLNAPLTPLRLGSLSTRTTHPAYIQGFQRLLDKAGLHIRFVNPYQYKTKGEMMAECRNQATLVRHAASATSCGRFARNAFRHCGRCVPCLVRRAAFLRWGMPDNTDYRYADLSIDDKDHRNFDDVRSMAMAAEKVRIDGVEQWAGSSLNALQLGDIEPYRAVLERSVAELRWLLSVHGVL